MWRRSFGVAAAILLIATLQTDAEGLEDVLEWFQAAGGRARKVRVVERDNTRFVVAASQIKAGEVVISTPQSMVLDEDRVRGHPEMKRVLERYDAAKVDVSVLPVVMALLREVYAAGSPWAKYIRYLPQRHLDVIHMNEDEAKAAHLHRRWFDHMSIMKSIHSALQTVCEEQPAVFGKGNCPDIFLTRWALSIVWSRAFKGRARKHRGDLAIIPVADSLNHAHTSSSSRPLAHQWCNLTEDQLPPPTSPFFVSDSALAYCLIAQDDYKAGDELFIDYGLNCNAEILATYGFVALDGHHDCATFHLAHSAAKLCWEKVKAIKAFNLLKDVRLYSGHVPPTSVGDFFHLMALPTCDAGEIEKAMLYSSNVTAEQDEVARRLWVQSLHRVKAQLQKEVKKGPWDTTKHDGLVQQLRQSELRAVDWHIRFASSSKTLGDEGSRPAEQWYERCLDDDARCRVWAAQDKCTSNATGMQKACCRACLEEERKANKCHENLRAANLEKSSQPAPPPCADSPKYEAKCPIFAKVGGCVKQKAFMAKFCCATCAARQLR